MVVWLCALLAAASPERAGARPPTGPVPAWVKPVTADLTAPGPGLRGIEGLLEDFQLLMGARRARYVHLVDRVTASEGLGQYSTLRIEFDPSYSRSRCISCGRCGGARPWTCSAPPR